MIVIDKDVMVPMTEGVRLATDVFRLQGWAAVAGAAYTARTR
jgi:predicted acyl esterase